MLKQLFTQYYGNEPSVVTPIKGSASNRQYFRLSEMPCQRYKGPVLVAIGTHNSNARMLAIRQTEILTIAG